MEDDSMIPIPIDDAAKYRKFKAFREQLELHSIPPALAHDVGWILVFDELPNHQRSNTDQAMVSAAYELLFCGSGRRGGVA